MKLSVARTIIVARFENEATLYSKAQYTTASGFFTLDQYKEMDFYIQIAVAEDIEERYENAAHANFYQNIN